MILFASKTFKSFEKLKNFRTNCFIRKIKNMFYQYNCSVNFTPLPGEGGVQFSRKKFENQPLSPNINEI